MSYKKSSALKHLEMPLQIFKKISLKAQKSLKLKSTSLSAKMNFACKICEESHFLNLCASFEPHLCSSFMNSDPSCPFLLPLFGVPLDCFTIYLCCPGNPTVWGWWLHHALVSRLKSFHFAGRVGIMTPGSTAVYLNPDSVLRMTMSWVYVCQLLY